MCICACACAVHVHVRVHVRVRVRVHVECGEGARHTCAGGREPAVYILYTHMHTYMHSHAHKHMQLGEIVIQSGYTNRRRADDWMPAALSVLALCSLAFLG